MDLDSDPLLKLFISALHHHCAEAYASRCPVAQQQRPDQLPPARVGERAGLQRPDQPPRARDGEELVGYLAPAPTVRSRFEFAPDAPRRPVVGGRVVSAAALAQAAGGAAAAAAAGVAGAGAGARAALDPDVCLQCLPFLSALGTSAEIAAARGKVCTHRPAPRAGAAPGATPRMPAFLQRKDTPDGFWSGGTADVPGSQP